MSKTDDLLKACQNNLGNWTCGYCGSNSNQPAATFRELKQMGYQFEEVSTGRWGKKMFCPQCGVERTHYKLLNAQPVLPTHERCPIDTHSRERVIALLGKRDAFTGATISSTPEIDHKVPWLRMTEDVNIRLLTDEQIKQHFQLLTREHNLLKDRRCKQCVYSGIRPPFFGISYWYAGDNIYNGTCEGCGWYDGAKWRIEINRVANEK